MKHFCTLFDSGYLTRGLAMYESLYSVYKDFRLYIFPFDEECKLTLVKMDLPNVQIVSLLVFEDDELLRIKKTRSRAEYYWTCTPSTILYCLKKYQLSECTYIDADLYFFSSPLVLFEELGEKSISIIEHRFTRKYRHLIKSGKYCVQFMTFRNNKDGIKALEWWRSSCIEWCYARHEKGRFGDQKYLDDWTERFNGVHELQNLGGGVAPWNVQQYSFRKEGQCTIGKVRETQSEFDVVFYHFHRIVFYSKTAVDLGNYFIDPQALSILYRPYLNHIREISERISRQISDFEIRKKEWNMFSLKNIVRIIIRLLTIRKLNIYHFKKIL